MDLIFGSSSELRTLAEVYAIRRWAREVREGIREHLGKVMNLDRFDLR